MKVYLKKITNFINSLRKRIAFYPSVFAILGFMFAFAMIYLEDWGVSKRLLDIAPQLVMEDGDTAKTLMSICIGGLISMMVFSFSMVMLLLSQASSNFSPRLLPGLISDRENQVVLGIYLATIVYNIFTLFNLESTGDKYTLPGFSVLLGVLATIFCFAAFIYFIHNISQSIQINYILDDINSQAIRELKRQEMSDSSCQQSASKAFPEMNNWHEIISTEAGYLQNYSLKGLVDFAVENDLVLYLTFPKGMYVLENLPIFKTDKTLDEETKISLFSNLNFGRGELISDNYILAFKQITEIILKAMSPGVNDPGTAVNCIDYLTTLLAYQMKKMDSGVYHHEGKPRLKVAKISFEELLYNVMASIRTYCKHDPIIVQKLLWMLKYLRTQEAYDKDYHSLIDEEIELLVSAADFTSPKDERMMKIALKGLSKS